MQGENAGKKRLLTGLQPSGQLHIGNYFGALKPFLNLYEDYESFLMVVDYHALTTVKDPKVLRQNILDVVADYLSVGVDPQKATFFKQSDISEHTELAWILECQVTVPFLMQAHSYKDKVSKGLEANAGLFNYPMLMAADILLYDTDLVPVGQDQKQHIEYTREAAAKFNSAYGETFKEPKEFIAPEVAVVPGTDGQKMSKSYKNTIPLFGSKDEIARAVMSIVTDSGPNEQMKIILEERKQIYREHEKYIQPMNLYRIHKLFRSEDELNTLYSKNQNNYEALKKILIEDIETFIAPMRERREHYAKHPEEIIAVIKEGGARAKEVAGAKMQTVREKIGVTL